MRKYAIADGFFHKQIGVRALVSQDVDTSVCQLFQNHREAHYASAVVNERLDKRSAST
jgi:limonene-1,2-epoxide hydrolase